MTKIASATIIEAPVGIVFSTVTDPSQVGTLFPGVVQIDGVHLPLQRGSTFRWHYVFLGMRFRGTWVVDEITAPSTYIATTDGGVRSRSIYTLIADGQRSHVNFEVEFDTPGSLLKNFAMSLIEPHMSKLITTYLETLRNYVERTYRAEQR